MMPMGSKLHDRLDYVFSVVGVRKLRAHWI